jgi:hypothetical protein
MKELPLRTIEQQRYEEVKPYVNETELVKLAYQVYQYYLSFFLATY